LEKVKKMRSKKEFNSQGSEVHVSASEGSDDEVPNQLTKEQPRKSKIEKSTVSDKRRRESREGTNELVNVAEKIGPKKSEKTKASKTVRSFKRRRESREGSTELQKVDEIENQGGLNEDKIEGENAENPLKGLRKSQSTRNSRVNLRNNKDSDEDDDESDFDQGHNDSGLPPPEMDDDDESFDEDEMERSSELYRRMLERQFGADRLDTSESSDETLEEIRKEFQKSSGPKPKKFKPQVRVVFNKKIVHILFIIFFYIVEKGASTTKIGETIKIGTKKGCGKG
jgi:hypothetical protein